MVDLACDMKSYDYFHSDDPVEAAKFVVSDAAAVLWESVLRHDGFAAFARRVPEQFIRWEADYGWTRRGYGHVSERETVLGVPLARLLATPDMWRTFAESYVDALDAAGRADPTRPRTVYGSFGETRYRRYERTKDPQPGMRCSSTGSREPPRMSCWTGSPRAPRLPGQSSPSCARGSRSDAVTSPRAATLATECLEELPGHQGTWTSLLKSARNCLRAPASCYPGAPGS
jgi:hypothetical protein